MTKELANNNEIVNREESKHWKIGEIVVFEDETKEQPNNGGVALGFNRALSEELKKEENADLRENMIKCATMIHEMIAELQNRLGE